MGLESHRSCDLPYQLSVLPYGQLFFHRHKLRVSLLLAFAASRLAHQAAYLFDLGRDHVSVDFLFVVNQQLWTHGVDLIGMRRLSVSFHIVDLLVCYDYLRL